MRKIHQISYTLPEGALRLTTRSSPSELQALFGVASRHNKKRGFLFVSKVLGRHIPVAPRVVRNTVKALAHQLPSITEPVTFIGLAETAVGLGAGVFSEFQRNNAKTPALYLCSTRHPVPGAKTMCEFTEPHSHATDHHLHYPAQETMARTLRQSTTLVLVDDEVTTGTTFLNLLQAVIASGAMPLLQRVFVVSLTDWSDGTLPSRSPLPLTSLALVYGEWSWTPHGGANVSTQPDFPALRDATPQPLSASQTWGRLGLSSAPTSLTTTTDFAPSDRVLVLGTNEFIWPPFLFAESLEQRGLHVEFSAITRSPIRTGPIIESVASFNDVYGEGIRNFVYNVTHRRVDKLFVCVEVPKSSICPQLLAALSQVAPHVEVVSYV